MKFIELVGGGCQDLSPSQLSLDLNLLNHNFQKKNTTIIKVFAQRLRILEEDIMKIVMKIVWTFKIIGIIGAMDNYFENI